MSTLNMPREESKEYEFNLIETDSIDDQLECLSAISNNELLYEEQQQQQDLKFTRVSSCFFSVKSGISSVASSSNDLLGMVDEFDEEKKEGNDNNEQRTIESLNAVDVLYHDILMQVLSFLSPVDLVSFSETGRRANFECFYYLQLQIQRALQYSHVAPEVFVNSFGIQPLVGTATFSRLASVGLNGEAEKLAQEFLDPHASLRTIPLTQRLECLRQAFLEASQCPSDSANVKAGLFLTVFGGMCASYMGTDIDIHHASQALFSLGLGASLVKAAKDRHLFEKFGQHTATPGPPLSQSCPEARSPLYAMDHPCSSDPYHHLGLDLDVAVNQQQKEQPPCLSNPSGCVGSYMRIIRKSSITLTELIKIQRCANFQKLSEMDRTHLSTNFIDACSSDDSLPLVKSIVTKHGIDVDAFYISSDGTETCALHCAAFNGACRILEFLCSGFDENNPDNDGGLCNVNMQDSNGWTALHFAAGSNCLPAVRILSSHDADLTIEAGNGYTPYHWAERLNNTDVTAELEKLGAAKRFVSTENKFSSLARSFFSNVIPA